MKAKVYGKDDGDRYWFYGGGIHLWKATVEDTGGAFFLYEDFLQKGKTTPLHAHPQAMEGVYVIEGQLRVHVDGEETTVGPGGFTLVPAGTPHALLVTSETARVLALQSPGHGQAFYQGASEPATAELEAAAPVDFGRLRESAERNGGIVLMGPPPFA
jgi:quercetin dioxygenase-like cupin family protein